MLSFFTNILSNFAATGNACKPSGSNFFSFPHWYEYLKGVTEADGTCAVSLGGLNDLWLVVLAIIEILLRIAAIAALIFVVYGGIRYITSRGNSDKITSSRLSIQDALIGLVISIVAIAIVSFVGQRVS